MQKWKYMVIHKYIEESQMNEFGANGWELVQVIVQGPNVSYYFKIPI
jgi:hypothetical protein